MGVIGPISRIGLIGLILVGEGAYVIHGESFRLVGYGRAVFFIFVIVNSYIELMLFILDKYKDILVIFVDVIN